MNTQLNKDAVKKVVKKQATQVTKKATTKTEKKAPSQVRIVTKETTKTEKKSISKVVVIKALNTCTISYHNDTHKKSVLKNLDETKKMTAQTCEIASLGQFLELHGVVLKKDNVLISLSRNMDFASDKVKKQQLKLWVDFNMTYRKNLKNLIDIPDLIKKSEGVKSKGYEVYSLVSYLLDNNYTFN